MWKHYYSGLNDLVSIVSNRFSAKRSSKQFFGSILSLRTDTISRAIENWIQICSTMHFAKYLYLIPWRWKFCRALYIFKNIGHAISTYSVLVLKWKRYLFILHLYISLVYYSIQMVFNFPQEADSSSNIIFVFALRRSPCFLAQK